MHPEKRLACIGQQCAICLDDIADGCLVIHSPSGSACEHMFHRRCAFMHLASRDGDGNLRHHCPLCRRDWREQGLLEVEWNGKVVRHFYLSCCEQAYDSIEAGPGAAAGFSGRLPCAAAPPTRNTTRDGHAANDSLDSTSRDASSAAGEASSDTVPQGDVIPWAPDAGEMTIRRDYLRPLRKRHGGPSTSCSLIMRCPLTGKLMPAEAAAGHLGRLLRDPGARPAARPNEGVNASKRLFSVVAKAAAIPPKRFCSLTGKLV